MLQGSSGSLRTAWDPYKLPERRCLGSLAFQIIPALQNSKVWSITAPDDAPLLLLVEHTWHNLLNTQHTVSHVHLLTWFLCQRPQDWRATADEQPCCEQQVSPAKRRGWLLGLDKVPQRITEGWKTSFSFFLPVVGKDAAHVLLQIWPLRSFEESLGWTIQRWDSSSRYEGQRETRVPNFVCVFSTDTSWCYRSTLCFSGTLKQNMTRTICVYIPCLEAFCTKG